MRADRIARVCAVLLTLLLGFLASCGDDGGGGDGGPPLGICGNGYLDMGEACDDGNAVSGDGCNATCTSEEVCGNGILDLVAGEDCDDGNRTGGDGCSPMCVLEQVSGLCGDGAVDAGEACDDGNTTDGDGCSADCRIEIPEGCGNGMLDMGEDCDDGNNASGDGCSADCVSIETCGNGYLDIAIGEVCDDGNVAGGDGCAADCRSTEACGDGILHAGEVCDDGNNRNGDGCRADCLSNETCGNGVLDIGESCDDANTMPGDGCNASCRLEPVGGCGNGIVEPGEGCDDGNTQGGDGCSASCRLESCGNGILDPGEGCDDGNTNSTDACPETCRLATCGDTFVRAGVEQCDDGNQVAGDGCSPACNLEVCGNGILDSGEGCDDGNPVNTDACPSCAPASCGDGHIHLGFEQCDDGNIAGGDGCSADCLSNETCGNGIIDSGELCDDGNASSGDACPTSCEPARCGDGYIHVGVEACDDANDVNGDGCSTECRLDACGSGTVEPGEECDQGTANGNPGSACFDTCISTAVAFAAPKTFSVRLGTRGRGPTGLEAKDINADGRLDLALAATSSSNASFLYGLGDGRMWAPHLRDTPGGTLSVQLADVNEDSLLDAVTANETGNSISVLRGTSFGLDVASSFSIQVGTGGSGPRDVAVADLTGDGNLDVVTANYTSDNVTLLIGNGAGSFTASALFSTRVAATGDGPNSIAVADLTGDGNLDIVTANIDSDDVTVLRALGSGMFAPAQVYTTRVGAGGDSPEGLAVADINNDGNPDVITANRISDDITVLVSSATGTLAPPIRFSTLSGSGGQDPVAVFVADVTGDSLRDVVTANSASDDVAVFAGTLSGPSFSAPVIVSVRDGEAGDNPRDIAVADMNADGVADILTVNGTSDDVSVLLGTGNGVFAAARAFESRAGYSSGGEDPRGVAVGDITGDGDLDVVIANLTTSSITMVAGAGDGLLLPAQILDTDTDPRHLAFADLDGNGTQDWMLAQHNFNHLALRGLQRDSGEFSTTNFLARAGCCAGDDPISIALGNIDTDPDIDAVVAAEFDLGAITLRNNGSGSFSSPTYVGMSGSGTIAFATLADVTGDTVLDLIGVNPDLDQVLVLPGSGFGSFGGALALSTAVSTSGQQPVFVTAADMNNDNVLDLVTANQGSNDVTVFIGLGSGSFSSPQIVPATFSAAQAAVSVVRVGDFNGDGFVDLATANRDRDDVSVIIGFGDGAFAAPQTFAVGNEPRGLAVGDFNGDSIDDIAAANFADETVTVLTGLGHP